MSELLDLGFELGVGTHATSQEDHFGIFLFSSSQELLGEDIRRYLFELIGNLHFFILCESLRCSDLSIDIALHC